MNFLYFIGIDVSKKKLDLAVRDHQQLLFHLTVDNSAVGFDHFKTACLERGIDLNKSLLCCEHTGLYSQDLLNLALQNNYALWLESALRIKRSIGLTRGKNNKVDAIRISEYIFCYADKAVVWQPEREILLQLRQLVALRKRLITAGQPLPRIC